MLSSSSPYTLSQCHLRVILPPHCRHCCHAELPTELDNSAQPLSPTQLNYIQQSTQQMVVFQQGPISGASGNVPAVPEMILL